MSKLGWVAATILGAVLLAGAAYQRTSADDNREVLLRIERQLIIQNHESGSGSKAQFKHRALSQFCDGDAFCRLIDHDREAFHYEYGELFLVDLEKAKGKAFRNQFDAWAKEQAHKDKK